MVGASGDLARKKIFPALYALYHEGMLPEVWHSSGSVLLRGSALRPTDRACPSRHHLACSTATCLFRSAV